MLKVISTTLFFIFVFAFVSESFIDIADARARGGGRSFGGSRSYSRPMKTSPTRQTTAPRSRTSSTQRGSSSFMRGLGGGLLGGFLGSMLFGGMGHAMGGGVGGSGIGLFEIILIGGLLYFLYKRFMRPKASSMSHSSPGSFGSGGTHARQTPPVPPPPSRHVGPMPGGSPAGIDAPPPDTVSEALNMIRMSDRSFDEEKFKEFAQDVFFKVQAGWMRRDISTIEHLLGPELSAEYMKHFQEMKQKGQINRLENIAIRKVEIEDAGVGKSEEYLTVFFTANLLDYTVDESTDTVIEGSQTEPVKFAEKWTFARPVGSSEWKLAGIDQV